MEIIRKSAWIAQKPEVLYRLVADIESYPRFLPWCSAARILKTEPGIIEASLVLSKGGISKSFSTRNILKPFQSMEIHLISGPFKHLEGLWTFEKEDEGTRVSLHLEFSFANRLIAMMIAPLFQPVASTLLEAFIRKANEA